MEQEAPQADSKEAQERDEEYSIVPLVETVAHPADCQVHEDDVRYRVDELGAIYTTAKTRSAAAHRKFERGSITWCNDIILLAPTVAESALRR